MAGIFWLLPQKWWKAVWKRLKSKQAKLARAKTHLVSPTPLLFPTWCQALPLAARPAPQGDGTDTAVATSPPELTLGINHWVSTQPPDPKCSLLVSRIHSHALGFAGCLHDHRSSSWPSEHAFFWRDQQVRTQPQKKTLRSGQDTEEKYLGPVPALLSPWQAERDLFLFPHFSPHVSTKLQELWRPAPVSTRCLAGVVGNT